MGKKVNYKMAAETKEKPGSHIPETEFVEDVDKFMHKEENSSVEAVLRRFDEQHQKYKFLESNISTKKNRLKGQIPDIKTSLDIVKYLIEKKDSTEVIDTTFLMSDQLYVKAKIPPTETVSLRLGANVMLEYNLAEADELLTKNLDAATKSLAQAEDDLSFIRDQTTTLEVNMARVYNFDVKKRQAKKGETD